MESSSFGVRNPYAKGLKHFPYPVANEQESKQKEDHSEIMPMLSQVLTGNSINCPSHFHSKNIVLYYKLILYQTKKYLYKN